MPSKPAWAPSSPYILDVSPNVSMATAGYQLPSGQLASLVDANGDICWQMDFTATADTPKTGGPYYFWSGTSPDGAFNMRKYVQLADAPQYTTWKMRGSDLSDQDASITAESSYKLEGWWRNGDLVSIIGKYARSRGFFNIRQTVNKVDCTGFKLPNHNFCIGTATGGALNNPTVLWLGSNLGSGTGTIAGTLTRFRAWQANRVDDIRAYRILSRGDSVTHAYATNSDATNAWHCPVLATFRTPTEAAASPWWIYELARPGSEQGDNDAFYASSNALRNPAIKVVIFADALNNFIIGSDSAATIAASRTASIAAIKADIPGIKIISCTPTPCRAALSSGQYTTWQGFRDNVLGTGANPVVGADIIVDYANSAANDGSDNLLSAHTADNLHEDSVVAAIYGALLRTALNTLGYGTG